MHQTFRRRPNRHSQNHPEDLEVQHHQEDQHRHLQSQLQTRTRREQTPEQGEDPTDNPDDCNQSWLTGPPATTPRTGHDST